MLTLRPSRAHSTAPGNLEKVFAALLILMSRAYTPQLDVSWARARRTVAAVDRFVVELLQFDSTSVSAEAAAAAEGILLGDPALAPEAIRRQSPAAETLVHWMRACLLYHRAHVKLLGPLTEEARLRDKECEAASEAVERSRSALSDAEVDVRVLTVRFEDATHEKSGMVSAQEETAKLHQRACELSDFLSAQARPPPPSRTATLACAPSRSRLTETPWQTIEWKRATDDLQQALTALPGDALMAAVLLTLGGPLSVRDRAQFIDGFVKSALLESKVLVRYDENHRRDQSHPKISFYFLCISPDYRTD